MGFYGLYLRALAQRADGPLQRAVAELARALPGAEHCAGPIKAETRIEAKRLDYEEGAIQHYGKAELSAGGVCDIARLSVCCDSAETLCSFYEAMLRLDGLEVVRQKNGFHPEAETQGGYRDVKLTALVDVPGVTGARHLCEVQLLLARYLELKRSKHVLYEVARGDATDERGQIGLLVLEALRRLGHGGPAVLQEEVGEAYAAMLEERKAATAQDIAAAGLQAREAGWQQGAGRDLAELAMLRQDEDLGLLRAQCSAAEAASTLLGAADGGDGGWPSDVDFDRWLGEIAPDEALEEIEERLQARLNRNSF